MHSEGRVVTPIRTSLRRVEVDRRSRGHVLEGTNSLFFPSLTIFAGCLVLIALRDQEEIVLDRGSRGQAAT